MKRKTNRKKKRPTDRTNERTTKSACVVFLFRRKVENSKCACSLVSRQPKTKILFKSSISSRTQLVRCSYVLWSGVCLLLFPLRHSVLEIFMRQSLPLCVCVSVVFFLSKIYIFQLFNYVSLMNLCVRTAPFQNGLYFLKRY